jgi:ABC-type sugar transport system ATPase subunit
MTENGKVLLEARGIVKDFPGQRALDKVDFDVRRGEVHALIGENGAGKSTLIKILAGAYRQDEGDIVIDGEKRDISNSGDSQALGLSFIHQDLNIVPHLSVAENIFLGRYPRSNLGLVRLSKMVEMAKQIPEAVTINANFRVPAGSLPIIDQWKIVINRALALNSRIIFMDEPTTSLTHTEVDELFSSIAHLKETGKAIVYVSHRMEEIFRIADRVTVIKDARNVGTVSVHDLDPGVLYHMMLGRELKDVFPPKAPPTTDVCLEVKNLSRGRAVRNVSFCLHKGEVLGIAGLVGSGRTELAHLLFGADKKDEGDIIMDGEKMDFTSPTDAIRSGIALVPEERHAQGLVLPMDVKQNITLATLRRIRRWSRIPILSSRKERAIGQQFASATNVKAHDLKQQVNSLSGGNQQKVVLSKWLCTNARILILDEPTKGIDIGARFSLYSTIAELAGKGVGIILISCDLREVVGMSHRILVLDQGTVTAEFPSDETNQRATLDLCVQACKIRKGKSQSIGVTR